MDSLEGILRIADNELNSIVKNGKFRSREEIESAEKLVKMAQKIYCIWEYEDGGEGYSERYPYARRSPKRDNMGRYSRNGGYGRTGGYSMHGDFAEELRSMMDDAPDEQTRQSIQRMLDQIGR